MSERHIPAELRRLVADRGQHCCEYCRTQARYSADSFTVDHIIPRSLGGSTTADNLTFCCRGCNQHTSKRTVVADPVTEILVRLLHPREQRTVQDWSTCVVCSMRWMNIHPGRMLYRRFREMQQTYDLLGAWRPQGVLGMRIRVLGHQSLGSGSYEQAHVSRNKEQRRQPGGNKACITLQR